jgi:opacity protein-like surface antigen
MKSIRLVAVLVLALAASASGAAAQQVRAPRAGEEVLVKQNTSGEELRGRFVELSPDSLSILVKGRRVDLPIDTVLRVDATHDSLVNGAAIGAAVLGGLCLLNCGQGLRSLDDLPQAALASAGWGALFGALFDAAHKSRTPVYVKAGPSGSALQVSIRF